MLVLANSFSVAWMCFLWVDVALGLSSGFANIHSYLICKSIGKTCGLYTHYCKGAVFSNLYPFMYRGFMCMFYTVGFLSYCFSIFKYFKHFTSYLKFILIFSILHFFFNILQLMIIFSCKVLFILWGYNKFWTDTDSVKAV